MVDADDDFGDLYGDLNCDMKVHSNGIESNRSDYEAFGNERVDLEDEKAIHYSESDEDDDFRILLNSSRKGGLNDEKTMLNNENDGINNGTGREIAHAGSNLEGYSVSCRAMTFGRDATSDQNVDNFRLPWHRSIFDINIDAFVHRPWSHRGADVTDYFNFGMDENSWKSYWGLVNCRKNQASMSNRQSVYETSLTNERGIKSSSKGSSDTEGRRSDIDHLPKGRAIEVECGFSERMPSIDMWRPMRSHDPNVVIQINMETPEDDESALYKNSMEHARDHIRASPSTSQSYSNKRTSSPHPHPDCQTPSNVISPVEHCPQEQSKILSRSTSDKFKSNVTCTKGNEDHLDTDPFMSQETSGYRDRVPQSSNSYNIESHSVDSKDILCRKEKNMVMKATSIKKEQSNVDSDYSTPENIVSDSAESEQKDSKNNSDGYDISSHNHKTSNGRRLKSVAEINATNVKVDSLHRMKRKHSTNNCSNRYSYCEFEPSYRNRQQAVKRYREKYCIDQLQNRDRREKPSDIQLQKHYRHINLDGKDHFKQKERYLTERCRRNQFADDCSEQKERYLTERCRRNQFADDCSEQKESEFSKRHHMIWDKEHCSREQDFPKRYHRPNWGRQHHRVRHEDVVYQRDLNMSERQHCEKWDEGYSSNIKADYSERRFEERDRRSLKYSDRLNFENDSFQENDLCQLDGRKGWIRNTECEEIASHARFNSMDIQAMHRRQMHCKEMDEKFDIKFNRPDYHSHGEIRSPERSRYDKRMELADRRGQIDDDNTNHLLDFHSYNDERMHWNSPPRDDVHFPWRSDEIYASHRDHSSFRDTHVKEIRNELVVQSIKHRHHLPYEDSLEPNIEGDFPEETAYHENVVSRIHMRRLCHLSNPSFPPQQGVLPSHERFVSQKSLEHSDLHVKKTLSLKQRLNFGNKLNNVKKIRVEARNSVNIDLQVGKHVVAVNNHLNGFKGKLPANRSNGAPTVSNKEVVSNCKTETLLKNSIQTRKIQNQDHDVEEGELIEGSQKKKMKAADIKSSDPSQSVKVVGIYNNTRILETLKKMEKRMERFKEPIASKKEPAKNSNAQVDASAAVEMNSDLQMAEAKEQRPVRKRRWCGN